MKSLTLERLQEIARPLNFAAVGATDASPFEELQPILSEYAKRGLTGFEVSDIRQRMDPRQWLPEAESIVVVAMAYLTEKGLHEARLHPRSRQHGQTSVYVYGEDYHIVLRNQLLTLHALLEEEWGGSIPARVIVDTSPMVDRRLAERAGIGWVGKNCMLIVPGSGSFVFLGAILLGIPIQGSQQLAMPSMQCGHCDLCLKACPTGALLAPGVIQATACLSYVTQMKGIIPKAYRAALGKRIFGCDTCQWVCPENRHIEYAHATVFEPKKDQAYPDLLKILRMSQRQFQKLYGRSAVGWRGVRTVQRNALIALGNMRAREALMAIIPFLDHHRRELRASAAYALGQIGGQVAMDVLKQRLSIEEDEEIRQELVDALHQASVGNNS